MLGHSAMGGSAMGGILRQFETLIQDIALLSRFRIVDALVGTAQLQYMLAGLGATTNTLTGECDMTISLSGRVMSPPAFTAQFIAAKDLSAIFSIHHMLTAEVNAHDND